MLAGSSAAPPAKGQASLHDILSGDAEPDYETAGMSLGGGSRGGAAGASQGGASAMSSTRLSM